MKMTFPYIKIPKRVCEFSCIRRPPIQVDDFEFEFSILSILSKVQFTFV